MPVKFRTYVFGHISECLHRAGMVKISKFCLKFQLSNGMHNFPIGEDYLTIWRQMWGWSKLKMTFSTSWSYPKSEFTYLHNLFLRNFIELWKKVPFFWNCTSFRINGNGNIEHQNYIDYTLYKEKELKRSKNTPLLPKFTNKSVLFLLFIVQLIMSLVVVTRYIISYNLTNVYVQMQ